MPLNDPVEVHLANVLRGALEVEQVTKREVARHMMPVEEPSQYIAKDFDERTTEDSNNCYSTPVDRLGICSQSLAHLLAMQIF
ncbi:hypothetical protein LIER_12726 [Lithospermum erythrorhizon]|uniref:Uncharacterized protein n=1 Tax=Lithospermum erythrorhizon TaxID=34254 RepID=A0AAV3PT24_LITER